MRNVVETVTRAQLQARVIFVGANWRYLSFDMPMTNFCLDGQRLRLVAVSGVYGGNGAEYRTEIESFSRIFSYGSGSNPDWFQVKAKDGSITDYGYGNGS